MSQNKRKNPMTKADSVMTCSKSVVMTCIRELPLSASALSFDMWYL